MQRSAAIPDGQVIRAAYLAQVKSPYGSRIPNDVFPIVSPAAAKQTWRLARDHPRALRRT